MYPESFVHWEIVEVAKLAADRSKIVAPVWEWESFPTTVVLAVPVTSPLRTRETVQLAIPGAQSGFNVAPGA